MNMKLYLWPLEGKVHIFVGISIGAKSNIMHPITCLLDTGAGPNIVSKDLMHAHWLLEMVIRTKKSLYSVSKDRLK